MLVNEARLTDAVRALRTGHITPSSYLNTCRDRFEDVNAEVEAFVKEERRWDRLEDRVDKLESTPAKSANRPPLYGVPVGIKDVFHVDGLPTRAGSSLPPSELDGPESAVWRRLQKAGAVALGKTITTEFAYFDPGPTSNPHDTSRTPGGSSSGSAAAVAAGLCPLALGTQTIGSVIRPAAFCGVVGFKPSYGRIPIEGVVPLSPSLDHVGFFTQDVTGARLAAAVTYDDWDTFPEPDQRPTLGVPADPYLEQAEEIGIEQFERHLDRLANAGYEVQQTNALSNIKRLNNGHNRLMAAEAATVHRENGWHPEYDNEYAEETLELLEDGDSVSAADIGDERAHRVDLRDGLANRMDEQGIDVWVSPAAPGPAPKSLDSTGDPAMNLPWTNAGLPTLTLPAGKTDEGLPVGLQCSARFDADEELLGWGERLADDLRSLTEP